MSTKTLREIAVEAWNNLKALLELHPTIIRELTQEHQTITFQRGGCNSWTVNLRSGFEIAQYPSMTAASKGLGISYTKVQRRLEAVLNRVDYTTFGEWISKNPELHGKIIHRFGLHSWPFPPYSFGTVGNPDRETEAALLPFVSHPDVAKLLADRFAELRGELEEKQQTADSWYRRCSLVQQIATGDDELIARLESTISPTKETIKQKPITTEVMQLRLEELDFSVRTYNCLMKAHKHTVRDITETDADECMNMRNFGRKSLVEVVEKLEEYGLTLKGWSGSLQDYWDSRHGEGDWVLRAG